MTSESAWITWLPQQHEILPIVRPSVHDQWPVRHAADVKNDRWRPPRPHKWCGPPTCTCVRACTCMWSTPHTWVVRCRSWQRRPGSNYIDDYSWWELPRSDSIDWSSPERVLGNLFPSREIYCYVSLVSKPLIHAAKWFLLHEIALISTN